MHDIRAIRADPAAFDAALARRGMGAVSAELLAKDTERRASLTALQEKQARRNALAREVGQGKRTGADTSALEAEAAALRADTEGLEKQAACPAEATSPTRKGPPTPPAPDSPPGPAEPATAVRPRHPEPGDS